MTDDIPFDTAPDAQELLDYLMWEQCGPQKREVALANARSLDAFGLAQLRAEKRHKERTFQNAGIPDTYNCGRGRQDQPRRGSTSLEPGLPARVSLFSLAAVMLAVEVRTSVSGSSAPQIAAVRFQPTSRP
jgi:hypothetical protein